MTIDANRVDTASSETGVMYGGEGTVAEEQQRLATFADELDRITIGHVDRLMLGSGTILVAGCGSSDGLTTALARGHRVYACDTDPSAVTAQRLAGIEAFHSSINDLSFLEAEKIDMVVARAVFGWLDEETRQQSIVGGMQALRSGGVYLVQEYDWSTIHVPHHLIRPVGELLDTMRLAISNPRLAGRQDSGFDPEYGSRAIHDIADAAGSRLAPNEELAFYMESDEVKPRSTQEFIIESARSLVATLSKINDDEYLMRLRDVLGDLLDDAARISPDEFQAIRLPDLATRGVTIVEKSKTTEQVDAYLFPSAPELRKVMVARHPESIRHAQRVQGAAYRHHRHVTPVGLTPDGRLSESLNPARFVDASTHLLIQRENGRGATVRVIRPEVEGGLPAYTKVLERIAKGELEAELPFLDDAARICELSAFGSTSTDPLDSHRLLAVGAELGRLQGYQYSVSTIVEGTWPWFEKNCGDAMRLIRDQNGEPVKVHLEEPGIRPGGISFVVVYFDLDTFPSEVAALNRARATAGSDVSAEVAAVYESILRTRG